MSREVFYFRVCESGHLTYSLREPFTDGFCQTCGSKHYTHCAKCGTQLPDRFFSPVSMGTTDPWDESAMVRPDACTKCGHVFPWTIAEQRRSERGSPADTAEALAIVRRLCARFHVFARQLRQRHDDRTTLDIVDEYDVQDALHALLALYFDDIRPEERTPTHAGKSARTDFLLKGYNIVIETKKTRQGLADAKLGDELIHDLARYAKLDDCKHLLCLVYDPDERIRNPEGLRKDLEARDGPPHFELFIVPQRASV